MDKKVKIGLIQMSCAEAQAENLTKVIKGIAALAKKGAQIISVSELFLSKYFCQSKDDKYFDGAELVPGPTTNALGEVAKKLGVVIIGSVFEKTVTGQYFNTAVVLGKDGSLIGKYRKMHIPADPLNGYSEDYYFDPGDMGFLVFDVGLAKVSPMICYDQWFPEGPRVCASKGAQILFFPTAIGWPMRDRTDKKYLDSAEHEAWQTIQRSHAIANNVFVVAINRVGLEGGLNFWGTSFVCDPYGVVLAKGSSDKEENILVECDLSLIDKMRSEWPFLSERRIKVENSKH